MRESIANSMVLSLILIFIIILIGFIAGSVAYTKAFNVKNLIIDQIEENHGWDKELQASIDESLASIGYRIHTGRAQNCKNHGGEIVNSDSNYRYCVEKFNTYKGDYFKVQTFMYFEVPIIGTTLEIPVSGETKIIFVIE